MKKLNRIEKNLLETPLKDLPLSENLKKHLKDILGEKYDKTKLKDFCYIEMHSEFNRREIERQLMPTIKNSSIKDEYRNIRNNLLYCEFVNYLKSVGFEFLSEKELIEKNKILYKPIRELYLSAGLQELLRQIYKDGYEYLTLAVLCFSNEHDCCILEKIKQIIFAGVRDDLELNQRSRYYNELAEFLRTNKIKIYEDEQQKSLEFKIKN